MIYSSRLKKILHYCLTQREEFVSLDELADLLKISKRTIFRELKDIDQDLTSYQLTLDNKSGKGLRVIGSDANKMALLCELQIQGVEYINKEERQHLLIFELLHHVEPTKLLHYANLFQVSEATISNDLDAIEPWFQEHHLTLVRKPGLGVEILAQEQDMRKAMTTLLHETLAQSNAYHEVNYFDSQTLLDQIFMKEDKNSIMRLLNQEILERVLHVFHMYQHELSLDRYAQSSYIGLIIHLVIAIDRILKNEEIVNHVEVLTMIESDASFKQAENMAKYLEIEFDIDIPETEIAFIALHIKGSKINNVEYNEQNKKELYKMQELIQQMLQSYDDEIRIQLVQDEELMHGLLTHLEPTIIRLSNHLPIYNPLLAQIKEMYHDLFEQTRKASEWISKTFDCMVSEDEIGFITMHIGASLERAKHIAPHVREVVIGVVCASGIGVSALLSARIKKAFPIGLQLHVLSMEEVLRNAYKDCEFLVSTFPLSNTSVAVYCVSPLLNAEDIRVLKNGLEECRKKEITRSEETQQDIQSQLTRIRDLSDDILEIIQHIFISDISSEISVNQLIAQIAKEHGVDSTHQEWIEEALLKRERLGSVIMNDFGFAMFHAITKGVKHSVLHIYYPDSEEYTIGTLNNLDFVVVLLSNESLHHDKQKTLSILSRSLIEHVAFYESIKDREYDQIVKHCKMILKEYFIERLEEIL